MAAPDIIAVYDLDRTVTRSGTFTPFLIFVALRRQPWRLAGAPLVALAMLGYKFKLFSRKKLKEIMLYLLLGRPRRHDLAPLIQTYVARLMQHGLHPGALRQIATDRAAGKRLMLATASFDFYVEPLARELGFDHVVATRACWSADDRLEPRIRGENCYGADKLAMLQAALTPRANPTPPAIEFYSDHPSDMPCFTWAARPYVVNPKTRFARRATKLGWPVLDWR